MQSVAIRGSVIAAIASVFVSGTGMLQGRAQEAALSANAELAAKGVWNAAATYAKDDIVTVRGSAWIAKRTSTNKVPGQTSPSTAADWQLFARGFNPLGTWSNVTKYQPDDLVTSNGQTYRAKVTNTNKQVGNTTYWELLVTKGATGATGATGPAGPNTGIGDGTQSAPSISFTGDSDTGIFHPAAGSMALVQNGALMLHTFGANNAGFGAAALQSNLTGTDNTGVGYAALYPNTSGSHNTAVGSSALVTNTSGSSNTGIGSLALGANSTGSDNTAVGKSALAVNTTGYSNVAIGKSALSGNTEGPYNIGIGESALNTNTVGASNVAIGSFALSGNTEGGNNIGIGDGALNASSTGTGNIGIGVSAGNTATNPDFSIFIGNEGDPTDTTTIKIGKQNTQTSAYVAGISVASAGGNGVQVYVDTITGRLTGPSASSARHKEDIRTMDDVTSMLNMLRPVTFSYKKSETDGSKPLHYGLIAEEVAEVMPYLAVFHPDGTIRTVHYDRLPTFLLAGWQAQQKTIAAQAEELRRQQDVNAALEARLARLEAALSQTKAAALRQ